MSKLLRGVALVGALLLVGATPAWASAPVRPFSGITYGVDSYGDPSECPQDQPIPYVNTGSGQVTHLGAVKVEIFHCTFFDPVSGSGRFGPGTITLTAANGDTLTLADWGTFRFVQTPDALLSYIDLEWEVIGGTGRFEGATGSGGGAPVGDVMAGTTTVTFRGSISY